MLKTYEIFFRTTREKWREILDGTDKNGQKLVKIQEKSTIWTKILSYHKKVRKMRRVMKIPVELKARPDIFVLEWYSKVHIVKEEKAAKRGIFSYYILNQFSYLLSDHHKYLDEYKTPISQAEYQQMSNIYSAAKETKKEISTVVDLWSSTVYKITEVANGDVVIRPQLQQGEELLIPDWLKPMVNQLTEEERLEIWRSNPVKFRTRRMRKGFKKYAKYRHIFVFGEREKTKSKIKDLRTELFATRKELAKTQRASDRRDKELAEKIHSVSKKLATNQIQGTRGAVTALNKLSAMVNGKQIDTDGTKKKKKLIQNISAKMQDEILHDQRIVGESTADTQQAQGGAQPPTTTADTSPKKEAAPQQKNGAPTKEKASQQNNTTTPQIPTNPNLANPEGAEYAHIDLSNAYSKMFKRRH